MVFNGDGVPLAPPVATIAIDHQLQSGQREYTRQHSRELADSGIIAVDLDLDDYQDSHQYVQQKTNAEPPAFDGAKHDRNGFCIRHSKVRMCHPVYNEGEKNSGNGMNKDREPIKYRTVRKFCPSCGMHQQHNSNSKKYHRGKVPHFPSRKIDAIRKDETRGNSRGRERNEVKNIGDGVKKDKGTNKKDDATELSKKDKKEKQSDPNSKSSDTRNKKHNGNVVKTQDREDGRENQANENIKEWCRKIKEKKEDNIMKQLPQPHKQITDGSSGGDVKSKGNKSNNHHHRHKSKDEDDNKQKSPAETEGGKETKKSAQQHGQQNRVCEETEETHGSNSKTTDGNDTFPTKGSESEKENAAAQLATTTTSSSRNNHLKKSKSTTDVQQKSQSTNLNSSNKDCNPTKTHSMTLTRGRSKKHIVAGAADLQKTNNFQPHAHAIDVAGGKPATVVQWEDASASQCVSRFTTTRRPTLSSKHPRAINEVHLQVPKQNQARRRVRVRSSSIPRSWKEIPKETTATNKQSQRQRQTAVRKEDGDGNRLHKRNSGGDVPLTKSPNVPRYTIKCSRSSSEDDNDSERPTGVYMMAAGLNLPCFDNAKDVERGSDDHVEGKEKIEQPLATSTALVVKKMKRPASSVEPMSSLCRANTAPTRKKAGGNKEKTSTALVVKKMKRPVSSGELQSRLHHTRTAAAPREESKAMSQALVVKHYKRAHTSEGNRPLNGDPPSGNGDSESIVSDLHQLPSKSIMDKLMASHEQIEKEDLPHHKAGATGKPKKEKHFKRAHSNNVRYNSLARDPPSGKNNDSSVPITSSQLPSESIMGKLMSNHEEGTHKDDSCGKTKARRKLKSQGPEAPGKDVSLLPSNLIMDKLMSNPDGKGKDASHDKSKACRKPKSQDLEAVSKQESPHLPSEPIMNKLMSSHGNNNKDSSNNKAKTQHKPNSPDAKVPRAKEASQRQSGEKLSADPQNHCNNTSNDDAKDRVKSKTHDEQEAPNNKKEASNDKVRHGTKKSSHDNHAKEQPSSSRDNPRGLDSRAESNNEVSESGRNLNKIMEKNSHVSKETSRGNTKAIAKKSCGSPKKDDHAKQLKKSRDKPQSLKKKEMKKNTPGAKDKDDSEVKKKGSSESKGKDEGLSSRGRSNYIETKSVQFKNLRRGKSLHSHTNRNVSAEDHTNAKKDKDDKKRAHQRSKSLPQRGQRQRLTCEHHVTTKPITTMSTYRNIFSELAQGSVFMVKDIVVPR